MTGRAVTGGTAQIGHDENAVRQALHRFRQRYQVLLREEIITQSPLPAISKMSCDT